MNACDLLLRHGITDYVWCSRSGTMPPVPPGGLAGQRRLLVPDLSEADVNALRAQGWEPVGLDGLGGIPQAVVVVDEAGFPALMRRLGGLMRRSCIVLPLEGHWVVPEKLRQADASYAAWQTGAAANYVARCNLKGHYLEFGTFWGHSFFNNVHRLRHWVSGKFFAFDSFAGLSPPLPDEIRFTGGDFSEGEYACSLESFRLIGELAGAPMGRIEVVEGFFDRTVSEPSLRALGINEGSVSVCYIDCDLKEPTATVLSAIGPFLEDGALVYFDDWRLCRASPKVGERAAALEWLSANPGYELIELHRDHWQHQWFIFQRR